MWITFLCRTTEYSRTERNSRPISTPNRTEQGVFFLFTEFYSEPAFELSLGNGIDKNLHKGKKNANRSIDGEHRSDLVPAGAITLSPAERRVVVALFPSRRGWFFFLLFFFLFVFFPKILGGFQLFTPNCIFKFRYQSLSSQSEFRAYQSLFSQGIKTMR